ncbi:MAG TPA: aminopeptidase P family protein [Kiloniellales bacterium]|jgi:Xaa-Pro aminopeptidase
MASPAKRLKSRKPARGSTAAAKIANLRSELAARALQGFIVPRADAHLGEYVPAHAQRLAWLTGFTGSAGLAVVLEDRAAIFVDGRYTLQVRDEVDGDLYEFCHLTDSPPESWITSHLGRGQKLGYDPWLHSESQVGRLRAAAEAAGGTLEPVDGNPVDAIWPDQPAPPMAPIAAHPRDLSGQNSADKRAAIAKVLKGKDAAAAILTQPDSIAWLLNVRGDDVPHTPLPLSFAAIRDDGTVDWFVARQKVSAALGPHLGNGVAVHDPDQLAPVLAKLGAAGARVMVDPEASSSWIFARLREAGATIVADADPCQLPKARKNPVELAGTRAAHTRDGAALTRFLAWLDHEVAARAEKGAPGLSEIEAAERLLAFRRERELFRDSSFTTISGSGPNGAIVHYRVTKASDRRLRPGELYLVDSGGQYRDGTTDVTRTVAIGSPSDEMRDRFTRVLKGHIALAIARFPRGTSGSQLDALARYHLWQAGLDYDHGTGHGVGSYLGVHEGPQRIAKTPQRVALEPGMIVSNEPGYYKTGAYGIRIENLVVVIESPAQPGDEREMLAFETLTLAPIDRRLVEPALLAPAEVAWLDAYHARVRAAHLSVLSAAEAAWLTDATRPVAE